MQCPNCKADCLDIERAKSNAEIYGNKTFRVSAPCCGAPLQVVVRRVVAVYRCEVAVVDQLADDWGVPYAPDWRDKRPKPRIRLLVDPAYHD